MKIENTLFIDHLPKIDLHGYDRMSASVIIKDFIQENIKLKNKEFVIIHGIGTGILKKMTHDILKKNKNVVDFMLCYNNIGSTIVRIKFDKN